MPPIEEFASNLPPVWLLVLVGVAAVAVAILILRIGRKLAIFLLIAGVVAVVGTMAVALAGQSAANYQTAQAATVASAGQTVSTVLITLLVLVILAALAAVGYFYIRTRRAEKRLTGGEGSRWLPGPNARWGRAGDTPPPSPADANTRRMYEMLQQLMMLEMFQMLRGMRRRRHLPDYDVQALPAGHDQEDDILWWTEDWESEGWGQLPPD